MRDVYAEGDNEREVLTGRRPIPPEVEAFPMELGKYSMKK